MQHKLKLSNPVANAYTAEAPAIPRTLKEANQAFSESRFARDWFGDEFVKFYSMTRDWEVRQFERAVTNWEMERYFESI